MCISFSLSQLLVVTMDVETPRQAVRETVTNVEEEDEQVAREKIEQERSVIIKLTAPCLKDIEDSLKENR